MAIEKGITCDINSGKVYGVRGNEVIGRAAGGYIRIKMKHNKKIYQLMAHQFIFYKVYGKIVEEIDHINGDRTDNSIENLREATCQQNHFNRTTAKGYSWHKNNKKYESRIKLNDKLIYLGSFDNEKDARQAYLDAKKIYHII